MLVDAASCQFFLVQRHIDQVTTSRPVTVAVLVVPVVRNMPLHWLSFWKSRTLVATTSSGARRCGNDVVGRIAGGGDGEAEVTVVTGQGQALTPKEPHPWSIGLVRTGPMELWAGYPAGGRGVYAAGAVMRRLRLERIRVSNALV